MMLQDGGSHEAAFHALLPMCCLELAQEAAEQLDNPDTWRELAEAAVHVKNVGLAVRYVRLAHAGSELPGLWPCCAVSGKRDEWDAGS